MELFFNLAWVALSLALLVLWIIGHRRWTDESLRSHIAWQFVALAMLIVILLPVISLTDDLQACANPAEVEHIGRRGDFQPLHDAAQNALPLAIAALRIFLPQPGFVSVGYLQPRIVLPRFRTVLLQAVGVRPPPVLA